jgi:hypothetical protein
MSAREFHHAPSLGKRLEPFLVIANARASQLIQLLDTLANGRIGGCFRDEVCGNGGRSELPRRMKSSAEVGTA